MLENIIERVNQVDGWFYERDMKVLWPYVNKVPRSGLIVEIGTHKGKSTLFFRLASNARIVTIDTRSLHGAPIDPRVLAEGEIISLHADSMEVLTSFNAGINLLFIDGSHDFTSVKNDLMWTGKVKGGGIVCLHDYKDKYPELMEAVNEWFGDNAESYSLLHDKDDLFIVEKR